MYDGGLPVPVAAWSSVLLLRRDRTDPERLEPDFCEPVALLGGSKGVCPSVDGPSSGCDFLSVFVVPVRRVADCVALCWEEICAGKVSGVVLVCGLGMLASGGRVVPDGALGVGERISIRLAANVPPR